jgi:hypothetical protein
MVRLETASTRAEPSPCLFEQLTDYLAGAWRRLKFLKKSKGKRKDSLDSGGRERTFAESLCAFSELSLHFPFPHSDNRHLGVPAGIMSVRQKPTPDFPTDRVV